MRWLRVPRPAGRLLFSLLGGLACGQGGPDGETSFGVGNWPPASYLPYNQSAWVNQPLPANPQIDPNSALIVTRFDTVKPGYSDGLPEDKCAGCVNDYDHPIYWAKGDDPVYTLTACGYSGRLNGVQIHALKGMLPGGGSDGHVVVMEQSKDSEYDFWQAHIDDNLRRIGGSACGRLAITGDGRLVNNGGADGDGANAAITGLYAGQIRGAEIIAGKIQHAIAVNVKCTNGRHVYPAAGNALSCSDTTHQAADGQFFQLTYSDAEIDALSVPAWKKAVLHAMHQYGFYVDDTFGGDQHSFALHFESSKTYQAFGAEDPFVTYAKQHVGQDIATGPDAGSYVYQLAPGVDWTRIRVIAPCTIQRTC